MTREEYNETLKKEEGKEFEEYIKEMIDIHFDDGFEANELNLIIIDPKKDKKGRPQEIAISIVVKSKEIEENVNDT